MAENFLLNEIEEKLETWKREQLFQAYEWGYDLTKIDFEYVVYYDKDDFEKVKSVYKVLKEVEWGEVEAISFRFIYNNEIVFSRIIKL